MSIENRKTRRRHAALNRNGRKVAAFAAAAAFAAMATPAFAFEIDTGNPEVKIHWDTQLKYTAAFRVKNRSNKLIDPGAGAAGGNTSGPSSDDGDRNFDKGLISNRIDVYSEFDVSYRGWGARASGAGWYDQVYNQSNDNNSSGIFGPGSSSANKQGAFNEFPHGTQELHGRKAELLDAFVFGRFNVGDSRVTFRAGRFAQQWGETLFFGGNGIAGGMAPIDLVKALSVPNVLFKELIRPVGQVSAQWQISSDLSIGAYYQFEWQHDVFPGSGSYFSSGDIFDAGGQYFLPPSLLPVGNSRIQDDSARGQGQFGAQVRFRLPGYAPDFGVYAIHYHSKVPANLNLDVLGGITGGPLNYQFVYAEDITAIGASVSNTFGDVNLAAEASMRFNAPLASRGNTAPFLGTGFGNADNPTWAVGHTLHLNVSALWSVSPNFISQESTIVAEVAYNHLQEITSGAQFLNPNAQRDGLAIFLNYEPVYRQVLPGLDISVPMGVTYAPMGNDAAGVFGAQTGDDGGSANIGVSFTYLDVWRAGIQYTRFLGPTGVSTDGAGIGHFDQSLKDRDFVSINVRRTF